MNGFSLPATLFNYTQPKKEEKNKQWCTGAMIIAKKNKTKQKTNKQTKKTGKAKVTAVFLH